ncbi:MAG: hypothetical protein ACYDER_17450 [Ktedonobacteraceae bacterium]
MAKAQDSIMEITSEQRHFLPEEEELKAGFFGRHTVQVDASQIWLLYRDGKLNRQLSPGRHSWWNGFFHKWRVTKINNRVELLHIQVKGRVKGPPMSGDAAGGTALELACDVTAELELTCKIAEIENFIQYRAPLSVFMAAIQDMVVEFIGSLSYDQYGQWATVIRNWAKQYLGPGGGFDAEQRVGIRVDNVFVTDFKPSTVQDRTVLSMYQLIERGKRELVEAQSNAKRDTVVAESFARQGEILNLAPSILALQDSPIGRVLIDRDADLRKLMVATGINPGMNVNIQQVQDPTGQLWGQGASPGYLNSPRSPIAAQLQPGFPSSSQVTGQIYPAEQQSSTPTPAQDTAQMSNESPVDDALQELELSELEHAGFQTAGRGQIVPSYDAAGRPVSGSKEWVIQVTQRRTAGYLTMMFHCPAGYPNIPPSVEVKSPAGGGSQRMFPNIIHDWHAGCRLADAARELAESIP